MRLQSLVALALVAASASPAYAAPSFLNDAQVVLSSPAPGKALKVVADAYLSEAKKAILRGKKEMETWYHEGKEYIKHSGLLC